MSRTALLSLVLAVSIVFSITAQSHAVPWSKSFGDASEQDSRCIDVDAAGNVVIAGHFDGSVDFGGGILTSAGGYDVFVATFTNTGAHVWSKRFGGTGDEFNALCAFDDAGNVYLGGDFNDTVDFGGGTLTSAGSWDIFIAMFNSAGVHQWSKRFGDEYTQLVSGLTANNAGVYFTGGFQGVVDFGGGIMTSINLSEDAYYASLAPNGNHEGSRRFGGTGYDEGSAIALDDAGNVVLTGLVDGDIDFGAGFVSTFDDIFVVKYTQSAAHIWSRVFTSDDATPSGIATDGANDVVITGTIVNFGFVEFAPGTFAHADYNSIYMAKLDASGSHLWNRVFNVNQDDFGPKVAVDDADHIVLGTTFEGTSNFGGASRTSAGNQDVAIAQFDGDGNHQWSQHFGDVSGQALTAIAARGNGNILVTGIFFGSIDFGSGPLTGAYDIFLASMSGAAPVITGIDDVPGDQGGWARIKFAKSQFDIASETAEPVINYHLLRRVDDPALIAQVGDAASTAASNGDGFATVDGRRFLQSPEITTSSIIWESVGTVPARQQLLYVGLVPTNADSMATVQYSVYTVMAQTTTPSVFFDSPPDSGYSVDNISPAVPFGFTAAQMTNPAALKLFWERNRERDFMYYALHRGLSAGFAPGPSNLIATSIDTVVVDNGWTWNSGYYYKLAAFDSHGNASVYALITPEEFSDATPVPAATFLQQNQPNPFSGSTRIAFGMHDAGPASLRVYDVGGKLVRVLSQGNLRAQQYDLEWDGRNDVGKPVASGVYFYRLETSHGAQTRKMLLLK